MRGQSIYLAFKYMGDCADDWWVDDVVITNFQAGAPIADAHIPLAVLPTSSNIPALVKFDTHRDADGATLSDLVAVELTGANTFNTGLAKAELETFTLDPDPTPGDAIDDISQVFVKTLNIPAYTIRLVNEITASTSLDLDMFLYYDLDGDGVLTADDYLVASSATSAVLEYINAPKGWIYYNLPDTYFLVVQNWAGAVGDSVTLATGMVPVVPPAGNYEVVLPTTNPAGVPFSMDILWLEDTEEGDRLYGYFETYADDAGDVFIGGTDIDIHRKADDVVKTADVVEAAPGDTITYTIQINNFTTEPLAYTINDVLPEGVTYVPDSVTGGAIYDSVNNAITWNGSVDASYRDYVATTSSEDPNCTLAIMADGDPTDDYLDWKTTSYGFSAIASISGDSFWYGTFGTYAPFNFYGDDNTGMDFTADGFVGWPEGVSAANTSIPDATDPNNFMGLFWDDLIVQYDAANNYGVSLIGDEASFATIEYDDVQLKADTTKTLDMEVGYFLQPDDAPGMYEIVFAYDNITPGLFAAASGTIGVENIDGTVGTLFSYNDTALEIADGSAICFDWVLLPAPPVVITFQVTVDGDAEHGLLINNVTHSVDVDGTLPEVASAKVEIGLAPVATDDTYSAVEDTLLIIDAPGVLANDTDTDMDPLSAVLVDDVANGTLTLTADGSFEYLPDANFMGTDTFTYVANDSFIDSELATVTITVSPVNDAPEAVDDEYSVVENGLLEVAAPGVLLNDIDVDFDNMVASLVTTVEHGSLVLLGDGSFTCQPEPDFVGTDTFVYKLITYPNTTQNMWTDEATVTITVTPANDAPVAIADAYSTDEDTELIVEAPGVLTNDIDEDALTAELVLDAANGTLVLATDGSFTYMPDAGFFGEDSFTYKAYDGELYSEVVTVTITVNEVAPDVIYIYLPLILK